MKNINKKILFYCSYFVLFYFSNPNLIFAWEKQTLFLFNNQVSYADWPQDPALLPVFHWQLKRPDGQIYRFDRNFSHASLLEVDAQTQWIRRNVTLDSGEVPHLFFENSFWSYPFAAHKLEENEKDFAYFTFQYKITNSLSVSANRPIMKMAICGQQYQFVLEKYDVPGLAQSAFFTDDQTGWTRVILANPGTCQGYSEIRWQMWEGSATDVTRIKLRGFSFSEAKVYPDDEIWLQGDAEQELALISGTAILARGQKIRLANNDWLAPDLKVGTLVNDEIVALLPLANFLTAENSPEKPVITALLKETDHSLSGLAILPAGGRLQRLVLAVAANKESLENDWQNQTWLENDFLANYQNIPYLSNVDGGQTFHLPAASDLDWQSGFYFAAKVQNLEQRWSGLSNIWFCQAQTCTALESSAAPILQLQTLLMPGEMRPTGKIVLVNTARAEIALENWRLRNQDAEVIELYGKLASGASFTLEPPAADWLLPEGGEIYLDNPQGELQDKFVYPDLAAGFSWQKDLITQDWKAVYVR